jgi:DNA-binding NarL/FixJ family response regulator
VLLVHDDPPLCAELERALQQGGVPTARAAGARAALARLECRGEMAIGLVISDYALRDLDGIQLLRTVRLRWPRIARILLLPAETDLATAARAVNEARVAGLMLQPCQPEALLSICCELLAAAAERDGAPAEAASRHASLEHLTAREREVLACLGRGASNAEIAQQLHLTVGSARIYVKRVLAKLGLRDRTKAALEARALGLNLGSERG